MLVITGVADDKYTVLDDEDGVDEFATIEELYLYKAIGIYVEGCHFTKDGLVVDMDGRLCPRGTVDVPEVWRPVTRLIKSDGFCKYEVSNYGNVRRAGYYSRGGYIRPRVMKPHRGRFGHEDVVFQDAGCSLHFLVHRLVYDNFVSSISDDVEINHLDECPGNNFVWNLERCTHKENMTYGTRTIRAALSLSQPVRSYTVDGVFVKEYVSASDAARQVGGVHSRIHGCCMRNYGRKTAYGLIWRYAFDDELSDEGSLLDKSLNKSVRKYTVYGTFVAEYDSSLEVERRFGFPSRRVVQCCAGFYKTSCGFIWRFSDSDDMQSDEVAINPRCRAIRRYTKDGVFIDEYISAREAGKKTGINSGNISSCANRYPRGCAAGGFIWRLVTDDEFADRPENRALIEEFHKRQQQEG